MRSTASEHRGVVTALDTPPVRARRGGLLGDLGTQPALGFVAPNWFAAVMGTGIVANAVPALPVEVPGLLLAARGVWVLATALLVVLLAATAAHWARHPATARGHLDDPVLSHFYGAPAMALLTVGAGALLVGRPVVGDTLAVGLAMSSWVAGTALGLWTAVAVPLRAFTTHEVGPGSAFGGWLMPVVPPMVSAATGPQLLPHLPEGQWRATLLLGCLAMFGLTLVASLVVVSMVWSRLVHHGVGPAAMVPTVWIVLGPLGQSITAAHHLGAPAAALLPAPYGDAVHAAGLLYGVPVWGFAVLWLAIALSLTVRTVRRGGLPFSLTWWSFTFPVGTLVTGTAALADLTGNHALAGATMLLYAGLVVAWVVVALRTARGAWTGRLLRRPVS